MSAERTYRWRTHAAWRHSNFPDPDGAPLTLVCFEGDVRVPLRASELAASHWAWLSPDDNESAAAPESTRPAA